ncbi:MAG: hypothetical protein JWQ07_1560 [Ramlibacter sp.]|nr:hypothetical protein [Ramlibacter sp.]
MSPTKPKETRKKPPALAKELNKEQKQSPGSPEPDGFSGQGSESALAHLRNLEQKRIDKFGRRR